MYLVLVIILTNCIGFWTPFNYDVITFFQLETFILCMFAWLLPKSIKNKSIFAILTIHYALVLGVDWYITYLPNWVFILYNAVLLSLCAYESLKNYDIKSDKINPKNVNLVFYKPKSFMQTLLSLFSRPVYSFGIICGKLYQLRRRKSTIQELDYTDDYIYANYIVIDTGVSIDKVPQSALKGLLSQKARQPKTLFLRLNCLRSFKDVLKYVKGYEYNGKILPSIYLRKIR